MPSKVGDFSLLASIGYEGRSEKNTCVCKKPLIIVDKEMPISGNVFHTSKSLC
jgi:hypothetical protein